MLTGTVLSWKSSFYFIQLMNYRSNWEFFKCLPLFIAQKLILTKKVPQHFSSRFIHLIR